jgi:hypothetical protein
MVSAGEVPMKLKHSGRHSSEHPCSTDITAHASASAKFWAWSLVAGDEEEEEESEKAGSIDGAQVRETQASKGVAVGLVTTRT